MRTRIITIDRVRAADAARGPGRLSARGEELAQRNAGFVDGVCHALDALHRLGYHEAYDAALAVLFVPAGEVER